MERLRQAFWQQAAEITYGAKRIFFRDSRQKLILHDKIIGSMPTTPTMPRIAPLFDLDHRHV